MNSDQSRNKSSVRIEVGFRHVSILYLTVSCSPGGGAIQTKPTEFSSSAAQSGQSNL